MVSVPLWKAQQFQDFGVFSNQTNYLALKRKTFKVLLRRNFDVMFITKNHLYQLINEDCHLKFD